MHRDAWIWKLSPAAPHALNIMIPGSKGLKSDAGSLGRGFLNMGFAKNMKKEPDQGGF